MSYRPINIANRSKIVPSLGPAPDMIWLPLEKLVLDDTYQRPLLRGNWTHIIKIASAFDWRRFTALQVAPISGGRYAVIDGQHRAHAAALCGIRELPCLSMKMSLEDQASAFSAINKDVTRVTAFHVFRAALASREHWALVADEAVREAGCKLMTSNKSSTEKKPGEVFSIRYIVKCCAAGEASVVTAGLSAIRKSEWGQSSWEAYAYPVLRPWFTALATNQRYLRMDLSGFFDAHDILALTERAREVAKGVPGKSGMMIAATAIVDLLDKERAALAA